MESTRPKKPSLATIANIVGVSTVAVHAALTGNGRVSAETRRRIQEVAEEIGYSPNRLARALRTKKTSIIGVLMTNLFVDLYTEMLWQIEQTANQQNYNVLFACSFNQLPKEREMLELLLSLGVDGLIVYPMQGEDNLKLLRQAATHIPMVVIERAIPQLSADTFGTDNFALGNMATRHLLETGRRTIAFLPPPSELHTQWWATERWRGCAHAVREAGMAPPILMEPIHDDITSIDDHASYGKICMAAFLQTGMHCDGLFAANDHLARGAMRTLLAHGIRVPEDVAVIGCDNDKYHDTSLPALTTMHQQMVKIGVDAITRLLQRLQGDATPPETVLIPPELIPRDSA